MTTSKTGNISLNAVRSDLGLAPGSLIDRAVCNRAGFSSAAKPSLEKHRGIACSPQALVTGGLNAVMTRRDTGYQGSYPYPMNPWKVTATEVGNGVRVHCEVGQDGYHPDLGAADSGVEYRINTFIPTATRLGVTGTVDMTQDNNYMNFSWQAYVLGHDQGYLQGGLLYYGADSGKNVGGHPIDIVTTSTNPSHPYVSLILYIKCTGGDTSRGSRRAIYDNVVMRVL